MPTKSSSLRRVFASLCILLCLSALLLTGCDKAASEWQDGYYTAETTDFDQYGWKEYLIICVSGGKIVSVDYNAKNASGLIKSWDMEYMREMYASDGTYPNEYTRVYAETLLTRQDPDRVDMVAGATHSHKTFQLLAKAAIELATTGNKDIAYVPLPEYD
ncbi:MAG: FMN-binding protein [Oscillospiraceae bacterium]